MALEARKQPSEAPGRTRRRSKENVSEAKRMERETGIEPATSSLGSWRSTAELLPLSRRNVTKLITGSKRSQDRERRESRRRFVLK